MAKTPEELEQIRQHNRKVLRELLFDSAKWLSTQHAIQHAIRALPVFGSAPQAAIELHKQMRSGALPWATRSCRLRDGLPLSHMITLYPAPADLDAVTPENLITGMREISEGDNTVVRCWHFVDLQLFNRWLGALAEQAGRERAAKERRAETANRKKPPLRGKMIIAILCRAFPNGFSDDDIAGKTKIVGDGWDAECKAPLGNASKRVKYEVPNRMTVTRTIRDYLKCPRAYVKRP